MSQDQLRRIVEAEAAFEAIGWPSLYAYGVRRGWFTVQGQTPYEAVFYAQMADYARLYSIDCIYQ